MMINSLDISMRIGLFLLCITAVTGILVWLYDKYIDNSHLPPFPYGEERGPAPLATRLLTKAKEKLNETNRP